MINVYPLVGIAAAGLLGIIAFTCIYVQHVRTMKRRSKMTDVEKKAAFASSPSKRRDELNMGFRPGVSTPGLATSSTPKANPSVIVIQHILIISYIILIIENLRLSMKELVGQSFNSQITIQPSDNDVEKSLKPVTSLNQHS